MCQKIYAKALYFGFDREFLVAPKKTIKPHIYLRFSFFFSNPYPLLPPLKFSIVANTMV